ncbi:hypothetical protein V8F06_012358 [Rhypophila decipiens]
MPDGRSAKQPRRPKQLPEGHFDPDELCRRLYLVLADQKAHAERKRKSRVETTIPSSSSLHKPDSYPSTSQPARTENASADLITELRRTRSSAKHLTSSKHGATETNKATTEQNGEYHHVPKEAAKQFARTTTVDVMQRKERESLVHQLSKRALKFHRQGGGQAASDPSTTAAPKELNRALRESQSQREKVLERNQFQRTRIMEEAANLDRERTERDNNRAHTFEQEISRILPENHAHNKNRRNSTGNTELFDRAQGGSGEHNRRSVNLMDPLLDVDEEGTSGEECPAGGRVLPHQHRVDWSQSDEAAGRRPKLLLSPLLKKADSLWGLRGRLGSKSSPSSSSSGAGGASGAGAQPPLGGIDENETGGGGASCEQIEAVSAPAALPAVTTPKSPKGGFFSKFRR